MIRLAGIGILAFLLFVLEQKIYQKLWKRGLTVAIRFQKESVFEGEENSLLEIVENHKKLPLSMLKVKFQTDRHLIFEDTKGSRTTDQYYRNDVFQIGGGERITRTLTFTGGKRGVYGIHTVDLVAADLFLTAQMVDTLKVNARLYVYPKPFAGEEFKLSLRQLNGDVVTKRHLLEDPFTYRGIREYQPFDPMRNINWKATARTGDLKVNQNNYTALPSVRIFLNLEDSGILKKTECVEAAIQIAAGLCEFFLGEGIQTACYSNSLDALDNSPLCLEASSGPGQMTAVYQGLARADIDRIVPFTETFTEKLFTEGTGTVTCFVAPNQYEDFVKLLEQYQESGREYVWFYPTEESNKPQLPETLMEHIRLIPIRK